MVDMWAGKEAQVVEWLHRKIDMDQDIRKPKSMVWAQSTEIKDSFVTKQNFFFRLKRLHYLEGPIGISCAPNMIFI
jgi:hypothetical protein